MRIVKRIGVVLVAVFAFSAVAAIGTATATEGPFFKTEGATLKEGESRLLLVTAKEPFLLSSNLSQKIECSSLTLPDAARMHIFGVAAGNGGTSIETLQYSGCKVIEGFAGCEVLNKTITTVPVLNLLGYASAAKGGPVLVLFEPETNKRFVNIAFENKGAETCTFPEGALVEGTVVGQAQVNGAPVGVGGGIEALHGEVTFTEASKTIWVERNKTLKSTVGKLTFAGNNAKLKGTALILVDLIGGGPVHWGVFS